jgi:hypothetical protein
MTETNPKTIHDPDMSADDIRQLVTERLIESRAQVLVLRIEALFDAAFQDRVPMHDTERLIALWKRAPQDLDVADTVLDGLVAHLGLDDDEFRSAIGARVEEIIRSDLFRVTLRCEARPQDVAC